MTKIIKQERRKKEIRNQSYNINHFKVKLHSDSVNETKQSQILR